MKKKVLINLINKGYSTRELAKDLNKSQTTIRYWLKKYDLKTKNSMRNRNPAGKKCIVCDKTLEKKNICPGCYTKIRRYRNKTEAVKIKGGKCARCGWSGPIAGFSFHHTRDKEFEIADAANIAWAKLRIELEKCELLCLNCHSIEHSNVHDKFLKAVETYPGKSF